MKNRISVIGLLLAVAMFCGCMTVERTTKSKDGSQTTSKGKAFLTALSGFDDQVTDPNGVSTHTSVANASGDVQMAKTLFDGANGLVQRLMPLFAANNTNLMNMLLSNQVAQASPAVTTPPK